MGENPGACSDNWCQSVIQMSYLPASQQEYRTEDENSSLENIEVDSITPGNTEFTNLNRSLVFIEKLKGQSFIFYQLQLSAQIRPNFEYDRLMGNQRYHQWHVRRPQKILWHNRQPNGATFPRKRQTHNHEYAEGLSRTWVCHHCCKRLLLRVNTHDAQP